MANNLRVFNTLAEYQSAELVHPAVSYVIETDKVHYDLTPPTPPVFQGKWKATYQDSHTESAQCGSSSEIVGGEINLTNLVSVEIGDCVTSIGNYAFQYCSSLTSVTIPNSVTNIGRWAFYKCSGLTSINIPSGVTSIGETAFADCTSLSSINIPSGVTSINYQAFANCRSLTSVTIPSGVISIGESAFQYCSSLTSVTVEAATPPQLNRLFPFLPPTQFDNTNNCPIYVPSASLSDYQTAWSDYASRIQAIP